MRILLTIAAGLLLCATSAQNAEAQRDYSACSKDIPENGFGAHGFYTFTWENDKFGGTDKNYTNGNRLAYTSLPQRLTSRSGRLAQRLLKADCDSLVMFGLAAGHSIFTPENTFATEPLPDQHPYAGWLYGEYSLIVARKNSRLLWEKPDDGHPRDIESLSLQIGIVGPLAGGEWVQNNFHRLIGVDESFGWNNQLENELGVLLSYDRRWQLREFALPTTADLSFDIVPSFGFSLGNVLTQASLGATLRFGSKLRMSDLPARVRPSTPGGGIFRTAPDSPFGWYLFAGVEGRAVAHNIFLDGNTLQDSLSVDKHNFVADFQIGAVLRFKNAQLSYTFVTRTEEFDTQNESQQFGSANLTFQF